MGAERRHVTVLDEDVVERQRALTVYRRPVAGVRRDDDDVAVCQWTVVSMSPWFSMWRPYARRE